LTRTATRRCANTRLHIALASRGLKAAATDGFSTDYRCDVPAKVVIRVRAVFKRPVVFRVDPRYPDLEEARGNIANGHIAVTTLRGRRPIVFASVHHTTGNARLFVAPSGCTRA
jgi:hypothetical protein